MKKIIYTLLMTLGLVSFSYSQYGGANRFDQPTEEREPAKSTLEPMDGDGSVAHKPGNPGGVPIDDYIPGLLVLGLVMTGFATYQRQRQKS
ncbi:hypothetical protein [Soonwooa purpurea]